MEYLKNLYSFINSRSKAIVVVFLVTAFFSAATSTNFVFAESRKRLLFSRLNLLFLAVSRSLLALAITYAVNLITITPPKVKKTTNGYWTSTNVFIDVAAIISCFWAPRIVLISILTLLSFGCPFVLAMYCVMELCEQIHKCRASEFFQLRTNVSSEQIANNDHQQNHQEFESPRPILRTNPDLKQAMSADSPRRSRVKSIVKDSPAKRMSAKRSRR